MDDVEKLARVLLQIFHERKDGMFIGALTGEPISYERLAPVNMAILKDATQKVLDALGYLPVEPVHLEVLGKGDWEKVRDEWLSGKVHGVLYEAVSQATITHNESKGQLYRKQLLAHTKEQ